MTLPLPFEFNEWDDAVDLRTLRGRLQEVLDTIAKQFPIGAENLGNTVLRLTTPGTSRSVNFVSVTGLAGMGGANRKQYTIAHGGTTTPVAWLLVPSYIAAASTSTAQNETVTYGRVSEDATNVVAQAVLSNSATAAVGPGNTFLVAFF